MKDICIDVTGCRALGDTLCATPVVKKISNAYNKPICVISNHYELFENLPYVEKSFQNNEDNYRVISEKYELLKTFDISYKENGVLNKHNMMDIRQFHAINLGFMLTKDEMELNFFPNPYVTIENLPDRYVLIHPVQNWESRTWDKKNWNLLIKLLNDVGIYVVAIGKDSSELGGSNVDKPTFNVEIQKGLNLLNKTNISQTWWLIRNSMCFVTMDSGLLHLAGTTNAEIIQLGSSINKEFRAPYRNGSQDFKYHYIGGSCNLNCASDMKYGIREWNSIHGIPSLVGCLERKNTFECHPSALSVYKKIIELTQ